MADRTAILPAHVEGTVQAIAKLHAQHHERATPFRKFTERLTAGVGQPAFVAWLTLAVASWIALNLFMIAFGARPIDEPPFGWLELAISVAALMVTILILSTQRRDDELATHREQLTLELAILGDQKAAKIIELLEETGATTRPFTTASTMKRSPCPPPPILRPFSMPSRARTIRARRPAPWRMCQSVHDGRCALP